MTRSVLRRSVLTRDASEVWARITTEAGIRDELRPVLRMSMPPGLRGRSIDDLSTNSALLGQPLGKAWLFLFGVLPVDYDDMTIVAIQPGHSFHESSAMYLLRRWEHQRTVETGPVSGCEVVDRLTFTARWPGLEGAAQRVVSLLFAHRHRRLRRWDLRNC